MKAGTAFDRSRACGRRQAGFTLLEALVAVALLALLGLAAAMTLNTGLRAEKRVGERLEALQAVRRAQLWLQRDLEQLVPRRGRTRLGDRRSAYLVTGAPTDSPGLEGRLLLDFYRGGRRLLLSTPPRSRLERVRYWLREDQLIRQSLAELDSPLAEGGQEAVLLERVNDLALRFFHQDQWHDRWPPQEVAEEAAALPAALEVTLDTPAYGALSQRILLPGVP